MKLYLGQTDTNRQVGMEDRAPTRGWKAVGAIEPGNCPSPPSPSPSVSPSRWPWVVFRMPVAVIRSRVLSSSQDLHRI
jgi:hypothetical protein